MSPTEPSVLVSTDGRAGRLVLNRPHALNALNREMVDRLTEALEAWERDPAVETVVLSGAGERGLCAGGDIRGIHEDVRRGGGAESARFWPRSTASTPVSRTTPSRMSRSWTAW